MHQASAALLSFAVVAGCSASSAEAAGQAPAPPLPSAGDLPTTATPDRDAAHIAALRAKGPAALQRLLAEYDRASAAARPALAATIDAVAAQRYATASRLYWYTDEAVALQEAQRSGRPILALRMLGRLDEDLSCANSRFFRTALYPDERVASLLREQFVLLWTSERPVPRVTIDYGDGRSIMGTVTGNSVHYVLDAEGAVVDALPGLYLPQVFARELHSVLAELAHERRAKLTGAALLARRQQARQDRLEAMVASLGKAGGALWVPQARRLLSRGDVTTALEAAQRAAMSKARVEVPLLHRILPGVDPGSMEDGEVAQWASVGQVLFGLGGGALLLENGNQGPRPAARHRERGAEEVPHVLDARARALISAVYLGGQQATAVAAEPAALLARFEQRMVADTAIAQVKLRPQILRQLIALGAPSMAELNGWVYAEVFATPRADQWLGLLPRDEYTGLPGDGVVLSR